MIELKIVHRMARRAAFLTPAVALALFFLNGWEWALSGVIGLALAVANLWLGARLIGFTAERDPQMLLVAGLAALFTGMIGLTVIGFVFAYFDILSLPVLGLALITGHLVLVLWETATAPPTRPSDQDHSLDISRG